MARILIKGAEEALAQNTAGAKILVIAGFWSSLILGILGIWTKFKYHSKPIHIIPASTCIYLNNQLQNIVSKANPPENPMSADRVKWEHIHRVFELCNRNVSETARRLKMHRRTLQRILSKRSPK